MKILPEANNVLYEHGSWVMTLVTTSTSVYQLFFGLNGDHPDYHEATTRLSDRPIWIRLGGNIGIDGVCNNIREGESTE